MEEDDTELRNPFPAPPSHYKHHTSHNIHLLSILRERAAEPPDDPTAQASILHDQKETPNWSLLSLEKPRVDLIIEDGQYNVFGDTWFLKERIPSLSELGGHQLYPSDPSVDRRPALLSILRSMLVSFSALLRHILVPPHPLYPDLAPEWSRSTEWTTVMAQNITAVANDLRPVQARCNLESMMQYQLALRREETKTIEQKCDMLELRLSDLRRLAIPQPLQDSQAIIMTDQITSIPSATKPPQYVPDSQHRGGLAMTSAEDDRHARNEVLSWAEST